jgi:arylsulfatase
MIFSADETTDIGRDDATPVSAAYRGKSVFTGKIHWVRIDLGKDSQDHLIRPEDRLSLAMTRQ